MLVSCVEAQDRQTFRSIDDFTSTRDRGEYEISQKYNTLIKKMGLNKMYSVRDFEKFISTKSINICLFYSGFRFQKL